MIKKLASIFQKVSLIIGILIILLFFAPMMFGIMPYIVLSGSMEPEIKTGSVAYINSHIKSNEIVVGDIIGFNTEDGQVTHRVVKINSDGSFVTKGDNNKENDEATVPVDKVKGKTIFTIPVLGRIVAFIKSKQGIAVVCVYIFLNVLCIIGDKKIYEEDIPNTFKDAIMKCESLEEIKKVIIEEMDCFKEQIIEDVSNIDFKELKESNQKLLDTGPLGIEIGKGEEGVNNKKIILEEKNNTTEIVEPNELNNAIMENQEEISNLLNRIDLIDEEEIDLDKVKQELVRYDNPKLIELRNNLKEQIEKSKIVQVNFSNNIADKNNCDEKISQKKILKNVNKAKKTCKSQKKNRKKNRKKNKKAS